jgi:hypothetical protein
VLDVCEMHMHACFAQRTFSAEIYTYIPWMLQQPDRRYHNRCTCYSDIPFPLQTPGQCHGRGLITTHNCGHSACRHCSNLWHPFQNHVTPSITLVNQ